MGLNKYKGFIGGDPLPAENVNSIDPANLVPQAAGYLTGGSGVSALSVFQALGAGSNNAKFKINIDGTVYDNVGIDLGVGAESEVVTQTSNNMDTGAIGAGRMNGQSFTTGANGYLTKLSIYARRNGTPADSLYLNVYAVSGDIPTGSALKTITIPYTTFGTSLAWVDILIGVELLPNTKYCFTVSSPGSSEYSNYYMWRYVQSNVYAGGTAIVNYAGSWVVSGSDGGFFGGQSDFAFKVFTASNKAGSYANIAASLQAAIRALTSSLETVVYSTDKFIISSVLQSWQSKVLKLMTPSTGTDISGAGATPYLDCAANATETLGTGEDSNLIRLGVDGKIIREVLPQKNYSTQDQAITAATRTYIAGSMLQIPISLKVGTVLKWKFNMTKTAAGNAASTFDICFGLAGTTADTARVSFTKKAGTAAADEAVVEIIATVRSIGATGVVIGEFMLAHDLASTGHATTPNVVVSGISAGFDMTVPKLKAGVCITSGASDAITIKLVQAEIIQL
jgi:hypothetical protein